MRILLIDPNGVRPAERGKALALARLGHRVSLLVPSHLRENFTRLTAPRRAQSGFRLFCAHPLGKPPNRFVLAGAWRAFDSAPQAVVCLADEDSALCLQALLLRKLLAPKAAFYFYAWQNLSFRPSARPQPSALLYGLDRLCARLAAAGAKGALAANGAALVRLVAARPGLPAWRLPWGFDPAFFSPGPPPPTTPYTIGLAGRLLPEKGVPDLLAASDLMARPHRLLVAGDGPLAPLLKRWAAARPGRLELAPPLPQEGMAGFYRRLHVLALPSRATPFWAEQFGRTMVEAMACGVAVAACPTGAVPEVAGRAAAFAPAHNPAALAGCLDRLADPAARAPLAAAGPGRAALFTWDAWAAKLEAVLAQNARPATSA